MRTIDADMLKEAFEMDGYLSPYMQKMIDACPTVGGEWISVKDRLPEREKKVLAFNEQMRETDAAIQVCCGWSVEKFATHWMPLPKAPKEE